MALEGSLHDLSLVDLIEIFRMGLKTGVLMLVGGAERGVVYVREGCLIDAVLVRGPARQVIATADDAVICLLQWEDAKFTFQPDSKVHGRPTRIVHDGGWLVLEGGRRREHPLQAPAHQRITPNTRLILARQPGAAGAIDLDLEQWRLLSQVAVSPCVRDICAQIGMEPDQAIGRLAELVAIGLVEIV
jgi:Domain of unknown function (DUF4388)